MDKRITLAAFKQNLEPYVGVPSTQFKVFRVYANNQEFESVRLNETLSSFSDDNKVCLRATVSSTVLAASAVSQKGERDAGLSMFSVDNDPPRKSSEKG